MTEFKWAAMFLEPAEVHVLTPRDGRALATDRYAVWDLDAVCTAAGIDLPTPGHYRAMARELRPIGASDLPGADLIAEMFDRLTDGADADDRLIPSEWSNSHGQRPIVRALDASVRLIDTRWDRIPAIGNGEYWVACGDYKHDNAAVRWSLYGGQPLGAVPLISGGRAPGKPVPDIEPRHLARAFALECDEMPPERVNARHGPAPS